MFAEALAHEGQPFSCGVPPALPLTALPPQVLVQVSFEEGQKSDVSAQYQHEEYLTAVFSLGTKELVVTSGRVG